MTGPLKSFDRTSDLGTLAMPVLFQCGEFDEARPETIREHAGLTPHAEVAIIPGAGHLTMIDAPELANAAIRSFLAKVENVPGRHDHRPRVESQEAAAAGSVF